MKYTFATLALSSLASAATLPRDSCTCKFTLTASGGQSGIVGQLSDGQNRIGGGNPTGEYCISDGQITDSQGRGCILTPPTTQFQCDSGATPTGGFSLGSNGQVEYNGSQTFYACPATDSMYNMYTTPVSGQTKCVEVQLTASGCYAQSSSVQPASSTKPVSQSATQPQTQTSVKTVEATPSTITQVQTIVHTAQASCPAPSTVTQTVVTTAEATCPAPSTVTVTKPAVVPTPQPASSQSASSEAAASPATQSATQISPASSTSTSTGKSCPVNLNGPYQYPHLTSRRHALGSKILLDRTHVCIISRLRSNSRQLCEIIGSRSRDCV